MRAYRKMLQKFDAKYPPSESERNENAASDPIRLDTLKLQGSRKSHDAAPKAPKKKPASTVSRPKIKPIGKVSVKGKYSSLEANVLDTFVSIFIGGTTDMKKLEERLEDETLRDHFAGAVNILVGDGKDYKEVTGQFVDGFKESIKQIEEQKQQSRLATLIKDLAKAASKLFAGIRGKSHGEEPQSGKLGFKNLQEVFSTASAKGKKQKARKGEFAVSNLKDLLIAGVERLESHSKELFR